MTANPLSSAPPFGRSPHVDAQLAELRELEARHPAPTWDDVRPDWEWLYAQFGTPALDPYSEQLVAVLNGAVVGSDPRDEFALRIRLARRYGLHPERFVVSYYG